MAQSRWPRFVRPRPRPKNNRPIAGSPSRICRVRRRRSTRRWQRSQPELRACNEKLKPSLRANGSRECAPDDRVREAIQLCDERKKRDCFVASLLGRKWESFTSPYRLDPPHFHPSGSPQGRYPTRNDKEKIEEAKPCPNPQSASFWFLAP